MVKEDAAVAKLIDKRLKAQSEQIMEFKQKENNDLWGLSNFLNRR